MTASGIVKPGDFGCSENSTAFPEMETGQNEIEAQGEPLRNSPHAGEFAFYGFHFLRATNSSAMIFEAITS